VTLRLLAAATGALACVALVGWTLGGDARHNSAVLGVVAALSSVLISTMIWNVNRSGDACLRAERALRESEEQLRLFIEGVLEYAILSLDRQGRVTSWNAGAERIKGYKPAEIIGRSVAEFYILEDVAAGKPMMELKMAAELGHWDDEGWRVRIDGTHFWANVRTTALRDDAGNLRGFTSVTRDTTARNEEEEEAAIEAAASQRTGFNGAHFLRITSEV
jgi:PAS domain S-box-containing protein